MQHLLEPLTNQQIEKAVSIFKRDGGGARDTCVFSSAQLIEPQKEVVRSYELNPNLPPSRSVRLAGTGGLDSGSGGLDSGSGGFSIDVDLVAETVVCVNHLPGNGQPGYNLSDSDVAYSAAMKSQEYRDAMLKRGITLDDLSAGLVEIDPWPGGGYVHPSIPKGHRAIKGLLWYRENPSQENMYSRPVPNLIAHIDLTDGLVTCVEDHGMVPIPAFNLNDQYGAYAGGKSSGPLLKPIEITQPDGPSFTVEGNKVSWANWEFRMSMHPIHGLVLHTVNFHQRPILFRAGLSEMVVPYGDPHPKHYWKHAIDAAEYVLGSTVNSLQLGCDCLGAIKYFDTNFIKPDGTAQTVKNGICLHEEDYGIGWKHTKLSLENQPSFVCRMRRLVISSFFSVGNYDYGFYWYLYLDGTIEIEVKLTGILSISVADNDKLDPGYAPLVSSSLVAPVHQHLFNFRMDWDLDGGKCSLYEDQVELVPLGVQNPGGNYFRNISRLLTTEEEAMRVINPENSRVWKIVNRSRLNTLGNPVAYKILPGAAQRLLPDPSSVVSKRATFARYNLWATPFHPEELTAAGDNPVMSEDNLGLAEFTKNNRSIVDCDLVTWHTIGLTHVPRPEDWPVMPTETCKLSFAACGFFDRNPIADLPCAADKASKLV